MRFKVVESLDDYKTINDDIYYYVSNQPLIGLIPNMSSQGIHMSRDITTCKELSKIRNYSTSYYYEFTVNRPLNAYVVDEDYTYWGTITLSKIIYKDKNIYNSLNEREKEFIDIFRKKTIAKKENTEKGDFIRASEIFLKNGYNCIEYKNTIERNKSGTYSTMFFKSNILNQGKLIEVVEK